MLMQKVETDRFAAALTSVIQRWLQAEEKWTLQIHMELPRQALAP